MWGQHGDNMRTMWEQWGYGDHMGTKWRPHWDNMKTMWRKHGVNTGTMGM